nr:EOG090X0JP1 [Lepidurus arcticus]
MIRRKKITIFTDAKETTPVLELKKIIQGITKIAPDNQRLYKDERVMEDHLTLSDYGLTSVSARAQSPATVGLAYRMDSGDFEGLDITSLSTPPELPDVMKPQEASHEQNSS